MNNLQNAIKALELLSYEELQQLVPTYNAMMKTKRSIVSVQKVQSAGGFSFGDVLSWYSNKRARPGRHYVKFEGYNRNRDCVVGHECDKDGKGTGSKWTVAISHIDQVNGKAIDAK